MVQRLASGLNQHRLRAERAQRRFEQRQRARVAFDATPGAGEVARHTVRIGEAAHRMHARSECAGNGGGTQRCRRLGAATVKHQHAIERQRGGQRGARRFDLVVADRQHDGARRPHVRQVDAGVTSPHEGNRRLRASLAAGQYVLQHKAAAGAKQAPQHAPKMAGADQVQGRRH